MKKFLLVLVLIAMFTFIPTIVKADPSVGQLGTNVVSNEELTKESTVYAGEVYVNGHSQMQWLYSSDISNNKTVFQNLKEKLTGTIFSNLVPTLSENTDNLGLSVSTSHQTDMNNNWTSAGYVAEQYYTGTVGTGVNGNLYDIDEAYKANIDAYDAQHQSEVNNPIDCNKRVLSVLTSSVTTGDYQMIGGVLTRVDILTFDMEATTVIYTRVDVTTSQSKTPITSADVTLVAPKVGDKVEKVTKDDGYGEYEAQSLNPTVTTTTEGISINAYWVSGLEELSEEPFYGTFEEGKYYYALIDFEAEEGYEFPSTFPDGIKINGAKPDEIFAVYGETYTHCIAKIKASSTLPTYEVTEGTNLNYVLNQDDTATFRIEADYSLFENGGVVYIDDALVSSDNYTSKSGSTIISLTKAYMNTLSAGNHTLKVVFNNGGTAEATFKVSKIATTNPQTGDNITNYLLVLGLCIVSIISISLYTKKRFN